MAVPVPMSAVLAVQYAYFIVICEISPRSCCCEVVHCSVASRELTSRKLQIPEYLEFTNWVTNLAGRRAGDPGPGPDERRVGGPGASLPLVR